MPRTQEAYQRLRENQRRKILEAARKVFALKGPSATMADVAAAAGISQGLAYRYFTNKEAILKELILQAAQTGPPLLQNILHGPESPGRRLKLLVSRAFENRGERLEYYRLFVNAMNDEATPEPLRKLLRKPGQAYQEALRRLIVEGQASGEVARGDPDQMVLVLMACLDGLSSLAIRNPERYRKHYPDVEIILRMLYP